MPNLRLPLLLAALLSACTGTPVQRHADVIVAGAGIAGLSAALEASAQGARVLLLDVNSVGGGHAVKAGGFALIDTALQRARGIEDSPDLAFADWAMRGDDPDTYWAYRYAQESATEVYDWLTDNDVEFRIALPTGEDSVPRFHFTRGTAVHVVVPLLRKALYDTNITIRWNSRVVALARSGGRINGVKIRDERSGEELLLRADTVILATGGLQNNLDEVLANWDPDRSRPGRLLQGAGHFATGSGYRLAEWAGADLTNMHKQEIFYNGVPNPRDPRQTRGIAAQNSRAIWVNAEGHRFIDETEGNRALAIAMHELEDPGYWMIFDANGAKALSMRDAPWLNRKTLQTEVLDNATIVHKAKSIRHLARLSGLPEHGLQTTIETWNRMVGIRTDFQFERFSKNSMRDIRAITTPPYYAIRTYPLTRKSMGGPAINQYGQVVDDERLPVQGLYAAGELTGVAGINGSHGGAGTFLGPSVLTGRIAGAAAARNSTPAMLYAELPETTATAPAPEAAGYWHFDRSHALVSERGYSCDQCHSDANPMRPANTRNILLARLNTCTLCH